MTDLSSSAILEELRAIALARATDFMAVRDGQLEIRSTSELTPQQSAAIASIERSTAGLKLKFYDKLKALELLGKYMGLFDSRAAWQDSPENNLLQAIVESTAGEVSVHDIPELQQAAAAGHDLVESAGNEAI
ncbi:MAG: terminase small subunit [Oscillospiraceae bacterium]|nr:terminase small subunit [Oscillospiraceae bacterium]